MKTPCFMLPLLFAMPLLSHAQLAINSDSPSRRPDAMPRKAAQPVTPEPVVFFPPNYQRLPEFPGGFDDMQVFIHQHIRYPEPARRNGVEGMVRVRLLLDGEGNIQSTRIMQSLGFGCDEEALRVIRLMPRWRPAQQGPHFVGSRAEVPIYFRMR